MIDNPAYKGEWVHPEIDNPDYAPDSELYKYDDIGAIGFDLWQVYSVFGNITVLSNCRYLFYQNHFPFFPGEVWDNL